MDVWVEVHIYEFITAKEDYDRSRQSHEFWVGILEFPRIFLILISAFREWALGQRLWVLVLGHYYRFRWVGTAISQHLMVLLMYVVLVYVLSNRRMQKNNLALHSNYYLLFGFLISQVFSGERWKLSLTSEAFL